VGATPGVEPGFSTLYPDLVANPGRRRLARRVVVGVLSVWTTPLFEPLFHQLQFGLTRGLRLSL
jgi:hypothetical protein